MEFDEYYSTVGTTVKDAIAEISYAEAEISELDSKMHDTKKYTPRYINETFLPQKQALITRIEERKAEALRKVDILSTAQVKELKKYDQLNPKDITEDAKLLNLGVTLSEEDLTAIFDRNKGNSTMEKLIIKYSTQNNIPLKRTHTTARAREMDVADSAYHNAKFIFTYAKDKAQAFAQKFPDNIYG